MIGRAYILSFGHFLVQMLQQNPSDFQRAEGVLVDVHVVGGDEQLRIRAVEMGAGIGYDSVGFFFTMVADGGDGVDPGFIRRQDADDGMVMDTVGSKLPG